MRPRSALLDALVAVLLAAALVAASLWLRAERVEGPARVVDGDTLSLAGRRIRLKGLDAPEMDQSCERGGIAYRCGEEARDALRTLVAAAPVACSVSGQDRYGRDLATCLVAGRDLGRDLVLRGLAVAYGDYGPEELVARMRGLGLWAGAFERPSEWRRRRGHAAR